MKASRYLCDRVKTSRDRLRIAFLVIDGYLGWEEVERILTTLKLKEKNIKKKVV